MREEMRNGTFKSSRQRLYRGPALEKDSATYNV